MIASSRTAKLAALSFAGLAHVAIALALAASGETMTEGSGGAAEVRLGNAFADMAAGALSAQTAQDTVAHAAPEVAPVMAERPDVLPAPRTWEKEPTANLTGSLGAYRPAGALERGGRRGRLAALGRRRAGLRARDVELARADEPLDLRRRGALEVLALRPQVALRAGVGAVDQRHHE